MIDTFYPESEAAKVLQLGIYSAQPQGANETNEAADPAYDKWKTEKKSRGGDVIDVDVEPFSAGQLPPEKKL